MAHVGRLVKCGNSFAKIGEFCPRCPPGRLRLDDGAVRCNRCSYTVGGDVEFLDDGPSLDIAVRFLSGELDMVNTYHRMRQHRGARIRGRRPYWAFVLQRRRYVRCVAWEGQRCPLCGNGQLAYMAIPEGPEEALSCDNPACRFALEICSADPKPDGKSCRKWLRVPLEAAVPDWLVRMRQLAEALQP